MKQFVPIVPIITALLLASCSSKGPDLANSIPDDAVAVMTMHPMQVHSKGKINTFENLKQKLENEIYQQLIEDPTSSGLMLNQYLYVFMTMEEEGPVIGMVAGMKDKAKFEKSLNRIREGISAEFVENDVYTSISPDGEGMVAWNDRMAIILGSPDHDQLPEGFLQAELDWMFSPVKEESLASMVDFKDFQGNMQDINLWLSASKAGDIIQEFAPEDFGNIPFNLDNNYSHMYCEFASGELNISGKTSLSEEIQKNLDEVLVLNKSLNQDLLNMAPGKNLLLAFSVSADLEKVKKLSEKIPNADLGEVGNQVEELTGIPAQTWLEALTGDLTLAINALEGDESMLPVELFIGLGVNSKEIQKRLMDNVEEMLPVEEEGDFFVINIQGNEIYSGILHDTWVITNVKGYKKAAASGSLENSLMDSRFKDYSKGSMGMFLNLELDQYPSLVDDLLDQNEERKGWMEELTASFDYLGVTAGGDENLLKLKTNTPGENSLYTLLKLVESQ